MVSMIRDATNDVFQLIRKYEIDCDAEQSGWLQPAHSNKQMEIVENRVAQWREHGAEVQLLSRRETTERIGSDFYTGSWCAITGGHIQPLSYARGLAAAVIKNRGQIHTQSPALEIT